MRITCDSLAKKAMLTGISRVPPWARTSRAREVLNPEFRQSSTGIVGQTVALRYAGLDFAGCIPCARMHRASVASALRSKQFTIRLNRVT